LSAGQFFNQHSFTIVAGAALAVLAFALLRDGFEPADLLALSALSLGLGLSYAYFNPGKSTESDPGEVLRQIGAGTPVLLEFQSLY
jgi:hypothetical protein